MYHYSIMKHLLKKREERVHKYYCYGARYPTLNQYSALTIANGDYISWTKVEGY